MSYTQHDGHLPFVALVVLRENAQLDRENLGLDYGYTAMSTIADIALARVELLERLLRKAGVDTPSFSGKRGDVARVASGPAPRRAPHDPVAQESRAREDIRPLGNVRLLPTNPKGAA